LETEPVLAKIARLSQPMAPGLHDAVVALRTHMAQASFPALSLREWVNSFYA
jgi:hypothetical protein